MSIANDFEKKLSVSRIRAKMKAAEVGSANVKLGNVVMEGYRSGYPATIGKLYKSGGALRELPIKTILANYSDIALIMAVDIVKTDIPYVKFNKHVFYYHRSYDKWFKNLSAKAFELYFEESLNGFL